MRKGLAIAFLSAGALGSASMLIASTSTQGQSEPLCRRPAVLPALPPEVRPVQDQQGQYREERRGDVYSGPLAPPPPPPPPPPPVAAPAAPSASADAGEASEVAVTGSRIARPSVESAAPVTVVDGGEARSAPPPPAVSSLPPPPPPGYYPRYQPQSGLLTAGDYDDLLNPALYARYVNRFLRTIGMQGVPRVDTANALTVAVQDPSGRPIPFAPVRITCADGNSLTLATVADGTAVFYPELDRLGTYVTLGVGNQGVRRVMLQGAGGQRQTVTLSRGVQPVRKFDLLVAIDTTGSMGDEIQFLKSELRSILGALARSHPGLDMRLSLVAYRDIGDDYVTWTMPFTRDLGQMQATLSRHYANGGGDYPEAMDLALHRAVTQDWRPDAVKSLLLVADAPPHDENIGKTWVAAEAARAKRIQIVPVAASGVADTAEYVMRAMAAATQSRYIFLTDDSGIGNPHAPPAVDCYLVTKLDALVRRVLDGQISGRRIEPREGEVIRSVGRYDGGKCILPADFDPQYQQ
ncbi:MAG TPA: vWA domain-containing protein [Allosphingosinicella sp.]|uniref:vWA domain-containing protein n=1 Tax=Allosphingosinicella sp. TaxID=2823234 RepID=UPI002ED9F166